MHNTISILIVEDMAITALEIQRSLTKMGYDAKTIARTYEEAIESIKRSKPDLMLIDIDLNSEKDGIDLAHTVQKKYAIPFIYLTSDDSKESMLRAVNTTPVAYLSKPFRREDLQSNILIALHKTKIQNVLQDIGNGHLYDNGNCHVFYKETPIQLSPNEKALLEILIDAKSNMVPFNIIESYVWGDNPPAAHSALRSLVNRLRVKLKDLPIQTIKGFGYRLVI